MQKAVADEWANNKRGQKDAKGNLKRERKRNVFIVIIKKRLQ